MHYPRTGAIDNAPIGLQIESFRVGCSMVLSCYVAEGIRDGLRVECLEEAVRRLCHDRAGLYGNSRARTG